MSIQWTWLIITLVGVIVLFVLAEEAFKDLKRARKSGERRLILNVSITWQITLALLIMFGLFVLAGVASLVEITWIVPYLLIAGIGQIVVIAVMVRRRQKVLYQLIEADIRARKQKKKGKK